MRLLPQLQDIKLRHTLNERRKVFRDIEIATRSKRINYRYTGRVTELEARYLLYPLSALCVYYNLASLY